jgi:hypothetical protein
MNGRLDTVRATTPALDPKKVIAPTQPLRSPLSADLYPSC